MPPVRRLVGRLLAAWLVPAALAAAGPALAQCPRPVEVSLHAERWIDLTVPIPIPVQIPGVTIDVCQPSIEFGKFGASVTFGAGGNNSLDADFNFDVFAAAGDLMEMLDDNFEVESGIPSSFECTLSFHETLAHTSGNANTYAFHAGGGGPVGQRVWGTIRFCDTVEIQADQSGTVELPVHVGATAFAAESFGDPNATYGRARVCLSGSVGGQAVSGGCVEVESESVIPIQAAIDEGQVFSLPVSPGTQTVVVDLTAEIESKSQAKGTGLFGTIAGAATAGVTMPGSVRIGNFTGPGGGALPAGLRIRSLTGGMTYANTSLAGVPGSDVAPGGVRMANPYLPGSTITVPAGPAAWWIHDVAGRVVASGTTGDAGGRAAFAWDGRNRLGAAAASGVYLLEVRSLGGRDVRRFVLLGR
jgi:hypothetical protein